jgi:hypothetical protein
VLAQEGAEALAVGGRVHDSNDGRESYLFFGGNALFSMRFAQMPIIE